MKLTKSSIVNQLCHELLKWKELNLRPEAILGTVNPQETIKLFNEVLNYAPLINTKNVLQQLNDYVFIRNVNNEFLDYFGVYNPAASNQLNPYFCATSLFREAISLNRLSEHYDEAEQTALIESQLHFAYPADTDHLNGVQIAVTTGNEEMVSFLLHPRLEMFNLADKFESLLDDPLVTYPPVRQAIFRACGVRYSAEMMDGLIQRVNTIDEWIALYDALKEEPRKQLMTRSDCHIWIKLNPSEAQIKMILSKIRPDEIKPFLDKLLSIINDIKDGPLVLRLMERMSQLDRQDFVVELGERANTLFARQDELTSCMTRLGYSIDANDRLKLNHLHMPDNLLVPVVERLNQEVWDSTLPVDMKLRYFHVTRQLLLANSNERQARIKAYKACIKRCESVLRDQTDAGLNWFWRAWNAIGRFFGFITDFSVTREAHSLLTGMNHAVARNPQFKAVILDLNSVIMPSEPPESLRRKNAIVALTASPRGFRAFWETMKREEREALFCDKNRFQQLLQIFSNDEVKEVSIKDLMREMTQDMFDELLDVNHPKPLLSLLQMPGISMETLWSCMGDIRKYQLLENTEWFGVIMSELPESFIEKLYSLMDQTKLNDTQNSLPHIQSVLLKADLGRLEYVGQYFASSIPMKHTPEEIGGVIEAMPIEKLLPFWTRFMSGRAFTVAEMARLLRAVSDVHKRKELITHHMTSFPITVWTDDLFILLPDMSEEQQASILLDSVTKTDDLRRLNEERKIENMISKLTRANHVLLLDRYRTAFSQQSELNNFFDQLNPACLELLLTKPPYEFLKILEPHALRGLIRALRARTDEQWTVILPHLLDMAAHIYGRGDPVMTLLQPEHVLDDTRYHILTLLRTCTDEEIDCLFGFLNIDVVKALIRHNKLDFKEITQDRIQEILSPAVNPESEKQLMTLSDQLFHELIREQLEMFRKQVDGLEYEIGGANIQATLLAMMVPKNGWTKWYYDDITRITTKWNIIVEEIKAMVEHHAELVRCCSIKHHDEAMRTLKPIHEKILQLATYSVESFINKYKESIEKTKFKVIHLTVNEEVDAVNGLESVRDALQKMDKEEEAKLLSAVPDIDIIHKMKTDDQLKNFYDLIVMSDNQDSFLTRCRNLLIRELSWNDISPSSLQLLSNNAPKNLFEAYMKDDFTSLVRAFHELKHDQWQVLAPNLLALRTKYFSEEDTLISLLRDNVKPYVHIHMVDLIKTAERNEDVALLQAYLSSEVVREYKKYHRVDDAEITINDLPRLMSESKNWFDEEVKSNESVIQGKMESLKKKLGDLKEALDVPKIHGFFGCSYQFNGININQYLGEISQILDQITEVINELEHLYLIQPDRASDEFMNAIIEEIKSKFLELNTFMDSEDGKNKLKAAPWCAYRDKKGKYASECLAMICKELQKLAGIDDDLEMSITISGSAASFN